MKRIIYVSIGLFLAIFISIIGIKSTQDILKQDSGGKESTASDTSVESAHTTAGTTDIWDYINGKQTTAVTTAPLLDADGNVVTDEAGVAINEVYANVVLDADGMPVTDDAGQFVTDYFVMYTTDEAGHVASTNLGVRMTNSDGSPVLDADGKEQYTMPPDMTRTTTAPPLLTMPPVTTPFVFTIYIN